MKPLYLILIASLLASCATVKKNGYYQTRRYNYGKHIVKEFKGKTKKVQHKENWVLYDEFILESKDETMLSNSSKTKTQETYAKIPLMLNIEETEQHGLPRRTSDSCDLIILRDSSTISCRITDMTLEGYQYSNCLDGKNYFIGREKIIKIHFADGRLVEFNAPLDKVYSKKEANQTSIVFLIIGFLGMASLIIPNLDYGLPGQ